MAINDAGQIAGYSYYAYSGEQAYRWAAKGAEIAHLAYSGRASGINRWGEVAGASDGRATVWDASFNPSYIYAPSSAVGINDSGQVAANMADRAVRWSGATMTILNPSMGELSVAEAINNSGQIVGWSCCAGIQALLWKDATAIDLGSLGGYSYAFAINNAGQVVGASYTPDSRPRAFLWENETMLDLNALLDDEALNAGWILLEARGINERGQIAGTATRDGLSGKTLGFLLTPVPEDTTPPRMTCTSSTNTLFPPNHKLHDVSVSVQVVDDESGSDGFILLSLASNEPDYGTGPDDVPGDIQGWTVGTPDAAGALRAERSGEGGGRVYTLVYRGFDKAGNHADCTVLVTVPHDSRSGMWR